MTAFSIKETYLLGNGATEAYCSFFSTTCCHTKVWSIDQFDPNRFSFFGTFL